MESGKTGTASTFTLQKIGGIRGVVMSLSSVIDRYADKTRARDIERMCDNALCSDCGERGIDRGGYYKCTTDGCDVLTFLKTSFKSDVADRIV